MNTVAVFESGAFNHSEPKESYINPCCFGDDLGRWLMGELSQQGASIQGELGQEDFGWYFEFSADEQAYCLVIGGDGEGRWYLVLERACGLIGSLLGGRHRKVGGRGLALLGEVLSRSEQVENLRWISWQEFRSGGAPQPGAAGG